MSLEVEINSILNPKTEKQIEESNKLFAYVNRLLKQFHLQDVEIQEVLNESFLRSIEFVNKGKKIKNFPGFIRGTILNVVREMSRKNEKYSNIESDHLENISDLNLTNILDYEGYSESQQQALKSTLKELNTQERLMISLWKIYERPWKEIAQALDENISAETARKRGQRLWSRVKQKVRLAF